MIPDPLTMIIPLRTDENGAIRVSGTSVTLDTVIARYHQGDSPETIHEGFDVIPLNNLQRRDEVGAKLRQEWETKYPPKVTKDELLARMEARKNKQV
jgi:hypothetical protein